MSKEQKKPRKYIPVEEAVARWRKDPAYVKEYDALRRSSRLSPRSSRRARRPALHSMNSPGV